MQAIKKANEEKSDAGNVKVEYGILSFSMDKTSENGVKKPISAYNKPSFELNLYLELSSGQNHGIIYLWVER